MAGLNSCNACCKNDLGDANDPNKFKTVPTQVIFSEHSEVPWEYEQDEEREKRGTLQSVLNFLEEDEEDEEYEDARHFWLPEVLDEYQLGSFPLKMDMEVVSKVNLGLKEH